MNNPIETDVKEIRDRVTRMESRMVQLGDHVGANLRAKTRIDLVKDKRTGLRHIEVDCYDVSFSRILTDLQGANWHGDFPLYVGDDLIATLHVK